MDYQKHYSLLIESRKQSPTESDYYEKHHILPRSLGGDDSKDNLVKLTAKEHFVAHLLLAKIYGGSMWAALAYMSRSDVKSAKGVRVGARLYAAIKKRDAESRSLRFFGSGGSFWGRKHTQENRERLVRMLPVMKGDQHPRFGKKYPDQAEIFSAVSRYTSKGRFKKDLRLRDFIDSSLRVYDHAVDGRWEVRRYKPKELIDLMNSIKCRHMNAIRPTAKGERNCNYGKDFSGDKNPMWGKEHKASTKRKIADKARRRIECPHCGKLGNIANMHRWHLDNCKKNPA